MRSNNRKFAKAHTLEFFTRFAEQGRHRKWVPDLKFRCVANLPARSVPAVKPLLIDQVPLANDYLSMEAFRASARLLPSSHRYNELLC